jgi:hypothetical protein
MTTSNHQLLNNISHKDLYIDTNHHPDFGDTASYTTIVDSEFRSIQAHYPIFFRKNANTSQFEAVALFGFAKQENLFLDQQGWHANYVPLSIQRRPFLIGFQETNEQGIIEKQPMVHIDMNSKRVNKTQGQQVFLDQGGQSDYLQKISSILMAIHDGHQSTKLFIDELLEHDLIEAVSVKVQLNDGSNHELASLYTINEEKLSKLDNATLSHFHQQGYLQHIYMVLASMSHISDLIDKKNQQL